MVADQSEQSNSLINSKALNLSDEIASQGDSRILKDLTRSYHSEDMLEEVHQADEQHKVDGANDISCVSEAAAKIAEVDAEPANNAAFNETFKSLN